MEISVDLAETGGLDIRPAKTGVGQLDLVDSPSAFTGLEHEITVRIGGRISQRHRTRPAGQGIGLINHRTVSHPNVPAPEPAASFALVIQTLQGNNRRAHSSAIGGAGLRGPQVNPPALHTWATISFCCDGRTVRFTVLACSFKSRGVSSPR